MVNTKIYIVWQLVYIYKTESQQKENEIGEYERATRVQTHPNLY